ncbi:MAG TPA: LytTR family transcriptional regulator DNA-binding domain-containing protein [Cyclobacteriaceae bacterium]|nr:LytTR family transcriptional regulator DNA-binding domain-containing protein [Cyclobacteriaceae bacterium]
MIRTIIIDDEPLAVELVEEYLSEYAEYEIICTCQNGFEGLKAIQEHQPDLIFLDIQMPKITGFELLELLDEPPAVIFTTAYDEYAIKAFEVHALDYLLKPFSKERFAKALAKYQKQGVGNIQQEAMEGLRTHEGIAQRVVLKVKNEIKIIPFQDIRYLEANDDFVNVYTQEGKFLKNKTLGSFEQLLDPQSFIRIHRSYIVKVNGITKIEPHDKGNYILKLKSGEVLPISKSRYPKLKEVLGF